MNDKLPRYRIQRAPYGGPFCWLVVDADGGSALWQADPKIGRVPLRFRSAALAQAAADKLNADAKGKQ